MHKELASLVETSTYVVALTGAGVSTLSGLPDFRGSGGLYSSPEYQTVFDLDAFREDPEPFYRLFGPVLDSADSLRPSLIHVQLAEWEQAGRLKCVITQNVDGLHQEAGSRQVLEMHGGTTTHQCLDCERHFSLTHVREQFVLGKVPRCSCGGTIKPGIVFFGENLDQTVVARATAEVMKADLLLILGSSLTVYPVASLPQICLHHGGRIVVINQQPTSYDSRATLKLDDLGSTFGGTLDKIFLTY